MLCDVYCREEASANYIVATNLKNKSYIFPFFYFREIQLITVFSLIRNPYMSWGARFVSRKECVGFSISDSVSLLLKFMFLFNKKYGLLDFKT